jgi:hypothetical protein
MPVAGSPLTLPKGLMMGNRDSKQDNPGPGAGTGRDAGHRADETSNARPGSHKFEGRRSANEAGDAAVNRPKPGRAQKKRSLKNDSN